MRQIEEIARNHFNEKFIEINIISDYKSIVTYMEDAKTYVIELSCVDGKWQTGQRKLVDAPCDKGFNLSNRFNNKDDDSNYFSDAKELDRMTNDVNEELENAYSKLSHKVAELEKEKELLKQRTDKTEKENNDFKDRLNRSERANTVISKDLEKIKKENNTLTNKIEVLENELLEVSKVVANIKDHYLHLLEKFTGKPSITEGQILQVKRLLEQGQTERQISQDTGVSKGTIWRIKNNRI